MTISKSFAWYGLACGVVITAAAAFDGFRGMIGSAAAAAICLAPLVVAAVRARLAGRSPAAKLASIRGINLLPGGMVFRLGFVLGGAFIAYTLAKDWLGVGFWVAVLVLYQVGLGLIVAVTVLPSNESGHAGPTGASGD